MRGAWHGGGGGSGGVCGCGIGRPMLRDVMAPPVTPSLEGEGRGLREALEGKGVQRWPQRRLDGRLEGVDKAVGGGYCRLQMPLRLGLGVRGTVAGHRLGALEGGGGYLPPSQCIPGGSP